jgi:hypothetical protein
VNIVSYERFDKDGIELVINTQTGESFATQAGYARMSGLTKQAISKRYSQTVNQGETKTAEVQTPQGLRTVNLIDEDLIAEWLPKDNPTMATQLLKLGVRVFMHKLAGFEITSSAIIEAQQPVERILPTRDAVDYIEAASKLESLSEGILKHLLKDALVDQISLEQNLKYLPVAEKPKQYTIVKVRAKALGYSDTQIGDGKQLGKFVKSQIEPAFSEQVGRYSVNHYEITEHLDTAIHRYFTR